MSVLLYFLVALATLSFIIKCYRRSWGLASWAPLLTILALCSLAKPSWAIETNLTPSSDQSALKNSAQPAAKPSYDSRVHLTVVGSTTDLTEVAQTYFPSATILKPADLRQTYDNNFITSLKGLPLNVGSVAYNRSISIRGQATNVLNTTQVLYNDIPLNLLDTLHGTVFGHFDTIFPTANLSSVEVIPGGGVVYGDNAQGGVISMQSDFTNFTQHPVTSITVGLASYQTRLLSASLGHNIFSPKVFAQFDFNGKMSHAYLPGEVSNSAFGDFFVKVKLTDNQSLGYSLSAYKETGKLNYVDTIGDPHPQPNASANEYGGQTNGVTDADNSLVINQLLYQAHFSNLDVDNNAFIMYRDGAMVQLQYGAETEKSFGNRTKIKWYYSTDPRNSLLIGFDFINQKNSILMDPSQPMGPNMAVDTDIKIRYYKVTSAAYLLDKHYLSSKLYSTAGYRLNSDYIGRSSSTLVTMHMPNGRKPGATITKTLTDTSQANHYTRLNNAFSGTLGYDYYTHGSVWASFEHGFVAPDGAYLVDTVAEASTNGDPSLLDVPNDIDYQHYNNLELGISQNFTGLGTYIKTAAFYSKSYDEIARISAATSLSSHHKPLVNKYALNLVNTHRVGVELYATQNITSHVQLYVNATLVKGYIDGYNQKNIALLKEKVKLSKDQTLIDNVDKALKEELNTPLPQVPALILNAGFSIAVIKPMSVDLGVSYTSKHSLDVTDHSKEIAGAAVLNVSAKYALDKFLFRAGVNNLLNKHYVILAGKTYGRPAMGRNYFLSLQYKL